MLKLTILKAIILSTIIVLIGSCKKEDTNSAQSCRLTKIIQSGKFIDTFYYKYNAQYKLIESSNTKSIVTYDYNGLSGTRTINSLTSSNITTNPCTFDDKGRLTTVRTFTPIGAGDTSHTTSAIFYNANDQFSQSIQNTSSLTSNLTYRDSLIYSGGNISKRYVTLTTASNRYLTDSIEYYYTTIENKIDNLFWHSNLVFFNIGVNLWSTFPLLGKGTKNLPSSVIVKDLIGPSTTNYTFSYILNDKGYVSEYNMVVTSNSGLITNHNFKLFYSCN